MACVDAYAKIHGCMQGHHSGIPEDPASQKFPAGIPGNFLILGGNFREF